VITVGVDPGKLGAIALVDSYGELVDVYDMPVVAKIVSGRLLIELEDWDVGARFGPVVIEDLHARPGNGSIATFSLGRSVGVVEGVFGALGLPIVYVSPLKWKKAMGVTSDKETSRRMALDTWPGKAAMFARKMDDGRAEAALIALWYVRQGKP
jgi:crossover junction endodeoxyribonuclease RuvC